MAILIIYTRVLRIVIYIFVIVNNSLVSYNTYDLRFSFSMVCRSTVTCHWRSDRLTEYHPIKNGSLRFSPIVLNCIEDFMIVFLEVALQSK